MLRVIDTHCHPQYFLTANAQEPIPDEALEGFLQDCFKSLDYMLMVAITLGDFELLHRLASRDQRAHMSIGIHPCHTHEYLSVKSHEKVLFDYASNTLVKALGETGLDSYHSTEHELLQEDFFRLHLECAATVKKPVIVHTRAAGKRTIQVLKEYHGVCGVIHCFTEDLDFARQVLDLGWMISFSGIITFPKARDIAQVVKYVPRESLLVETDAPYLAPVPFRGKTNHPTYVSYVAAYASELMGVPRDDFIVQLHANYNRFLTINQ